jgi:hypothetical protein
MHIKISRLNNLSEDIIILLYFTVKISAYYECYVPKDLAMQQIHFLECFHLIHLKNKRGKEWKCLCEHISSVAGVNV